MSETNLQLLLWLLGFYFIFRWLFTSKPKPRAKSKARKNKRTGPSKRDLRKEAAKEKFRAAFEAHEHLIAERAQQAESGQYADWYYKSPTDRQLRRLEQQGGLAWIGDEDTRGSVSEMIGMLKRPKGEDTQILKFLEIPYPLGSDTEVRFLVEQAMADANLREIAEQRPLARSQREMLKFLGVSIPRGARYCDMESLLPDYSQEGSDDEQEDRWTPIDDWETANWWWGNLQSKDELEGWGIKKPKKALFWKAIDETLETEGSLEDVDLSVIIDILVEKDPSLESER